MQSQLRLAHARSLRRAPLQRRSYAVPPTTPVGSNTTVPPTPLAPGALPSHSTRPVAIPAVPVTPGSSSAAAVPVSPIARAGAGSAPPPPPPPPPPKRGFFRRALLYTTFGALVFYPTSAYLSTKYEPYRELFVNLPGGEALADYADDHAWGAVGKATPAPPPVRVAIDDKARAAQAAVKAQAGKVEAALKGTAAEAERGVDKAAAAAKSKAAEVERKAKADAGTARAEAGSVKDKAVAAAAATVDRAKELAGEAKQKVADATERVPFNFSDGVEGIVREAERALDRGEQKIGAAAHQAKDAVEAVVSPPPAGPDGQRRLVDTQRPRELRPETVTPQAPSFEGKQLYTGPPLPLGHEPPPGFYLAPPAKAMQAKAAAEPPRLPLLGPKVKEFAAEEPIIAQLASTIDSLASSLAAPAIGAGPSDASGILGKAQNDLSALSRRLDDVKKAEKARLEKTVEDKTREFEHVLKGKEEEWHASEKGLKEGWEKERQGMVDEWRKVLEGQLEAQREGIEKRLREEVVSQGIELQRRWLRSIKSQVETERGGRLSKLDALSSSLKQLERITLDNSAALDDNVRLHKIWSALRAVQAKVEAGDATFADEVRVLKAVAVPADATTDAAAGADGVVRAALESVEKSGATATGVKSLAALSAWFTNAVAPRIHQAALLPEHAHEAGVVAHATSRVLSALLFRPEPALVDGADVGAVLARAQWCLAEKDLDGAAREVNSLRGWPRKLADDWLREVRRKLEVQQALEIVGTEATLRSLLLV
ncbi:MICOS complex subunit mic60 [Cryptotrichosporon argae]